MTNPPCSQAGRARRLYQLLSATVLASVDSQVSDGRAQRQVYGWPHQRDVELSGMGSHRAHAQRWVTSRWNAVSA